MNFRLLLTACFLLLYLANARAQTLQKTDIITDKLNYRLSNDRDSLYINISATDSVLQRNILGSGITFTLNTGSGHKSITFPLNEKKDENNFSDADSRQLQMKVLLIPYRKIKVSGFTGIADELLSCRNSYGIRAAICYNYSNNQMRYTLSIPLKLLQAGAESNKEWPYSIKVNRLERTVIKYIYFESLWGGIIGMKPDKNGNYDDNALRRVASSSEGAKISDQYSEWNLNQLKAGKAKYTTWSMTHSSRFSTLVIPLTQGAEFSGRYVLQ